MENSSSDRTPVSSIILFASVILALTAYFTFRSLWEMDIPVWYLAVVLGLQFAAWLLGSRKILTQLGAASLSAVIAVVACIGAVFLVFPPLPELRIAGAIGSGTALLFILASFVAASRTDPVPSSAPEPLVIGDIEEDPTAEIIKYGEIKDDETVDAEDQTIFTAPPGETASDEKTIREEAGTDPLLEDKVYQFDELSESKLGIALGDADIEDPHHGRDLEAEEVTKLFEEKPDPMAVQESDQSPEPDTGDEPSIPDEWVEEATRSMAYEASLNENRHGRSEKAGNSEGTAVMKLRTRFKVLDSESGEHYGTYYGDEGYSTLDPGSLTKLLDSKVSEGELRIVKLDWSNFDEVEVHIKVEVVVPIHLEGDDGVDTGENVVPSGKEMEPGTEAEPALVNTPSKIETREKAERSADASGIVPAGPRYIIYDRRTIQPMGEYVPEGDRSRIDRLTLYRMFPEYDYKTFEIDSVRWEGDEVRIFIKGEKKGSPKSKVQGPKK